MSARRLAFAAVLALVGCSGGETPHPGGSAPGAGLSGGSHVGGAVVATVDGVPITLDDVRRVVASTHLAPRAALERLVSEALLASEAQRRGLGRAPGVQHATRQALAQAMLEREVEARVRPESVTAQELSAAFDAQSRRFDVPERRASVHVLARMAASAPPDVVAAGRRFAAQAIADFQTDSDPDAWLTRHAGITGRRFEVRAERVPPLGAGDPADPAYIAALDGVAANEVVPTPVRSSFGWHAIVVTEVVAAHAVAREEAFATLRQEIVTRRRAARLEQLFDELGSSNRVVRNESAIRAALSIDLGSPPAGAAAAP